MAFFLLPLPPGRSTPWRFFTYFPNWKVYTMAFRYLHFHLEGLHHGVCLLTFPTGRFTPWCFLLTFPPGRFTPWRFFTYFPTWKVYTMVFLNLLFHLEGLQNGVLYLHFHLEGLHYDGFLLLVSYPTADATHIDSPKPLTHQNH